MGKLLVIDPQPLHEFLYILIWIVVGAFIGSFVLAIVNYFKK